MAFANRREAGRLLAGRLQHLGNEPLVVLGLPRGGVPVAFEVAEALGAPLDVILVRKLGLPFQPELALGAIGEDSVRVLNAEVVRLSGVSRQQIADVEARERIELQRRAERFRAGRPRLALEHRTALIVDDGIATGSTARAACEVARAHGAARVVLAVPVAPPGWTSRIGSAADEMVCLATPQRFEAVGQFYDDFSQTTDDEVMTCLEQAASGAGRRTPATDETSPMSRDDEVEVRCGPIRVAGHLTVPERPSGVVIFAHGSGSSRHSTRNQAVARVLNQAGLATLLFDLLTTSEETDRSKVFDVALLARRLEDVTAWLRAQPGLADLPVGYFGASTGAAAALWAAAEPRAAIAAVVSRGGRPDLAWTRLALVRAPTLLIVGSDDTVVLDLNRRAEAEMRCETHLDVVPGATHLFEEPGTLALAADAARRWFTAHLPAVDDRRPAAIG